MPEATTSTTPQQQPNQENHGGFSFSSILTTLLRVFVIFTLLRAAGLFGGNKQQQTETTSTVKENIPSPPMGNVVAYAAFPKSCAMILSLYASYERDRKLMRKVYDNEISEPTTFKFEKIWQQRIFYNDDESNKRTLHLEINNQSTALSPFYDRLIHNETVYIHGFLQEEKNQKKERVLHFVHPLNKHLRVIKSKKRNLLFDSETKNMTLNAMNHTIEEEADKFVSHYVPTKYLTLVDLHDPMPLGSLPAHFVNALQLLPVHGKTKFYYPVLYFNEFWTIREHYVPLNDSLASIPLTIELSVTSAYKWQFFLQMEESLKMQKQLGSEEEEQDEIKRMLFDTNPYLLAVTIIVSILHSIFDFLAFKNDIQFYKNQKSMEGLSIRSIFVNCFFQTVIFLYLFDNDTSWMVLISNGIGLLIEYWKVTKVVDIKIKRSPTFPYFLDFSHKSSYVNSKTKEHDDEALRYLSYLFYPLILGYAIYALFNHEFKSWYSFVLSTIVGFIYMFGFLNSIPQVYVNYKLKSVAAMPWRAFTYKALNTFIDDLFAFVIKMPTLHRIACFRDDVIFFIYLYQRWIYPVDPKRVNEFGQTGEETHASPEQATTVTTSSENQAIEDVSEDTLENTTALDAPNTLVNRKASTRQSSPTTVKRSKQKVTNKKRNSIFTNI
ncbi:hypothetical protein C9374_005062 [Naegleria lovaniensis]|uniref:Cleft lip and palate associated transmembrane protein n=1 Tax=Naegleria lovaniensis TaxID=51637 RepID=A0AA88GQ77_NAELO|nr:uncharacterized protein C9374_005062 [Naegleria lovaniensis]KAG2382482.1 hypothetical protein C9374_005062 [Naegleria lovaniensis]